MVWSTEKEEEEEEEESSSSSKVRLVLLSYDVFFHSP
jgi:hypothetical protein